MSLASNWTRDGDGNYVDWLKPPYRLAGSGLIRLHLEGEDPHTLDGAVRMRRIREYYALCKRAVASGK